MAFLTDSGRLSVDIASPMTMPTAAASTLMIARSMPKAMKRVTKPA